MRFAERALGRVGPILAAALITVAAGCATTTTTTSPSPQPSAAGIQSVGTQYDSAHVYVDPGQFDAFVRSWTATFGGTTTAATTTHVTPTPSTTRSQLILSPVGTLSVFGYLTPIPYPFGTERGGWLMADLDAGLAQARAAGATVVVAPFADPIGRDTVVQFPGGVNVQLYWHTTAPSYPPLRTVPDSRIYLGADALDPFLHAYRQFSGATIDSDDPAADGALVGRPGTTFRRIHLSGQSGNTTVLVTDGQLPYPYGHDTTGYGVPDVGSTIAKAQSAGAVVLAPPRGESHSAILQFPGGYVAEIHSA